MMSRSPLHPQHTNWQAVCSFPLYVTAVVPLSVGSKSDDVGGIDALVRGQQWRRLNTEGGADRLRSGCLHDLTSR